MSYRGKNIANNNLFIFEYSVRSFRKKLSSFEVNKKVRISVNNGLIRHSIQRYPENLKVAIKMGKIVYIPFSPTGYSDLPGNKEESSSLLPGGNLLLAMANKHEQQFNRSTRTRDCHVKIKRRIVLYSKRTYHPETFLQTCTIIAKIKCVLHCIDRTLETPETP